MTLVCIGHSHTRNVQDAATAAGVPLIALNFWELPKDAVTHTATGAHLSGAILSRLAAPVFSLIGGAVNHDIGLVLHPRPWDVILPDQPDLPLSGGHEILPYDAVREAMRRRITPYLQIMTAVRAAVRGPMFHMQSPPPYGPETIPPDDPGFAYFYGENATYSPPWMRYRLWRIQSGITAEHCARENITFIPRPEVAVDAEGFLLEAFHGKPAHANAAYGALVLAQMQQAAAAAQTQAPHPTPSPVKRDPTAMPQAAAPAPRHTADDARAMAAKGDLHGAITAAAAIVRRNADPALLTDLVDWRMAVMTGPAPAAGRATWPPEYPDPFPGQPGLPAIHATELTDSILGGALLHHGALRVNGLMDAITAARLREGIDRAFTARDRYWDGQKEFDPGWYRPIDTQVLSAGRNWSEANGGVMLADSPHMLAEVIEAFTSIGVLDCIEAYMKERPALSVGKATLRRVPPTTPTADWHQDGAFLGGQVRSVNIWTTLSHCGIDASTLEVVARRLPFVVQTGSHGARLNWTVGQGLVDTFVEGGAAVLSPVLEPGDAVLFDHLLLHRTGSMPGMTKDRYAIESWFFAPSHYPMKQVPLFM
jgi:hypothetical protein